LIAGEPSQNPGLRKRCVGSIPAPGTNPQMIESQRAKREREVLVHDNERALEIERLLEKLSEARKRRTALAAEAQEFVGRIDEIRAVFGNPYFYTGANRDPSESIANYSGFNSHDVLGPTAQSIRQIERELRRIKEQLRELGVNVD